MKPSRAFLACLLVGCFALSLPDLVTTSRAAEQVGQTRNAVGEVAFKRENDQDFIPVDLAAGDVWPVFNLDWWRTGPDSTCEIFLDNGSIFVMKPESILLVRVDRKKKTVNIELQQGSVKLITINSPDYKTNLLTPSAMVTMAGALAINKVESEGHLYVENESGEVSIVHNYGTVILLGEGQAATVVTDFSSPDRIFTVSTPEDNPGPVVAQVLDRLHVNIPAGSRAEITNRLDPGRGGTVVVDADPDNRDVVLIVIGDPNAPDLTHETEPGERVTLRFDPEDAVIEDVRPGDLTNREIPRPDPDDPFENPNDIVPPPARPVFVAIPGPPPPPPSPSE